MQYTLCVQLDMADVCIVKSVDTSTSVVKSNVILPPFSEVLSSPVENTDNSSAIIIQHLSQPFFFGTMAKKCYP